MHLHNGFLASSTPKFLTQFLFQQGIIKYRNYSVILDGSRHCSNKRRNGVPSFQTRTCFAKRMSSYPARDYLPQRKTFSLIQPRDTNSIWGVEKEVGMEDKSLYEILRPGMLLLRGYLNISEQDVSRRYSNKWRNGVPSFQPHTHFAKQMSSYAPHDHLHKRKKFSLILPRDTKSILGVKKEVGTEAKSRYKILGPGMLLLRGFLSINEQVEVVKKCEKLGVGPGGFYEPYPGAAKLRRLLMCLGRNWQPETQYKERFRRNDGSEAPPIPDEFVRMVENILQASRSLIKSEYELPFMSPDVCLLNFYTDVGNLALHQDRSESPYSLRVGLPVVSISFGDSGVFLYGFDRHVDKASSVLLESGDVLVFGGKSRLIYHGVKSIIPNSAPLALLTQTMLRPGRLNLTFREY